MCVCVLSVPAEAALLLKFDLCFQGQFWMRKYVTSKAFKCMRSVCVMVAIILLLLACLYAVL